MENKKREEMIKKKLGKKEWDKKFKCLKKRYIGIKGRIAKKIKNIFIFLDRKIFFISFLKNIKAEKAVPKWHER